MRRHLFRYRDVLRITRVVEPETTPDSGPREAGDCLAAIFELEADFLGIVADIPGVNFNATLIARVALRTAAVLVELAGRVTARIRGEIYKILFGVQTEEVAVSATEEQNGESDGA